MRRRLTPLVALSVAIVAGLLASAALPTAGASRVDAAPSSATLSRAASPGPSSSGATGVHAGPSPTRPSWFDQSPPSIRSPPDVRTASSPYPTLNWTNQTSTFDSNLTPNAAQGAAVAYDPSLGDYVMVGSICGIDCPTDATWLYGGNGWYNATSGLVYDDNFPTLYGQSLAWDPDWGGLMMVGGTGPDGPNLQTWMFEQATPEGQYGWFNFTAVVGVTDVPFEHFGSMAWDPALNSLVYAGGCVFSTCYNGSDTQVTHLLPGSDESWELGNILPSVIWGASMTYDQTTRDLLLYGGSWPNSVSRQVVTNETWIYDASGDWSNISYRVSASNCADLDECYYPAATYFSGLTWDGQINQTILVGGETGAGTYSNQTLGYERGRWFPLTELNAHLSAAPSETGALIASNSSYVAPTLIGGRCQGSCGGDAWVLEIPPRVLLTEVRYNPVDVGAYEIMSGTFVRGTGSGPRVEFGIGNLFGNFTSTHLAVPDFWANSSFTTHFIYGGTGHWVAAAVDKDFLGVEGYSTLVDLTVVSNVTTTVSATPMSSDLVSGTSTVDFTTVASGGTGSDSTAWDFGDGTSGSGADVSHVYTGSGPFEVRLNTTDTGGGWSYHTLDVEVNPELLASSTENVSATDVGVPVNFSSTWTGGSGSPTFRWEFGDGKIGSTENETHVYARSGTMQVNLSLTDSLGYTTDAPALSLDVNPALGAAATTSDSSPAPGTNVSFAVTTTGGTAPFTYTWTFDDGSGPAHGAMVDHIFSKSGSYAVAVTVRDKVGSSVTKTLIVSVRSSGASWLTSPPGDYVLAAGIVLAGVAVAGVLLIRRRKGGKATATKSESADEGATSGSAASTVASNEPSKPGG